MDVRIALLVVGVVTLGGLIMVREAFDMPAEKPQMRTETALPAPISVIPTTKETSALPQNDQGTQINIAITTPAVSETIEVVSDAVDAKEYLIVNAGCDPDWSGECLNVRSGPGTTYPSVLKLRNGVVLASGGEVEVEGERWYKVIFDEWVRYPERLTGDLYVAAAYVQAIEDVGTLEAKGDEAPADKRIVVDRSEQKLYAYEGEELFMEEAISTGLDLTPTPRGTFTVFKKTPSRYMQGPLPGISSDYYDLPGVPWNLYFTEAGGAIHGTYWHDNFGQKWSHGCVNLPPEKARQLYDWAPLGTTVVVQD